MTNSFEECVIEAAMRLCGFAPPPEDKGTPRGQAFADLVEEVKRLRLSRRRR